MKIDVAACSDFLDIWARTKHGIFDILHVVIIMVGDGRMLVQSVILINKT